MSKCFDCGNVTRSGETYCLECRWERRQRAAEASERSSSTTQEAIAVEPPQQKIRGKGVYDPPPAKATKNLKVMLWVFAALVAIGGTAGIFAQNLPADLSASEPPTEQIEEDLSAMFFDANTVPLFVGRTAESAVLMMRDRFGEQFWDIKNKVTREGISTFYDSDRDLEKLEGLFVCSQSMAPGADIPDYAFGYLKIEVSDGCANQDVSFAMGPAAELLGRYVPAKLEQSCYDPENCDLESMDGIVIGFAEEGFQAYKTVIVETGLGVMEAELALITLPGEWCESTESQNEEFRSQAIAERDKMLPPGTLVRLVSAEGLYGKGRFIHRLSPTGAFPDGDPPTFSVNERLVSTGYWIPDDDAGSHDWEHLYTYRKGLPKAVWKAADYASEEGQLAQYRKRILKAANLSFMTPNETLATCLDEKRSVVVALQEEDEEERRRAAAAVNKRASDIEAIWRSVFCADGGAADYPERCKNYNPAVDDKVGAGSGGGGSNCTWVNGHMRNGSSVRGHWRCG